MAFETSTLVNGSWTTRTLDVDTVLRHYNQQDQEAITNAVEVEATPRLGVLSQTVIPNPLVHWILPAKLRTTSQFQDVAFVGDDFVQIKELRPDGLLWDVVRKDNFGARIRNARVLGIPPERPGEFDEQDSTQIKHENGDFDMGHPKLPPECIVLQLDTGDSVFLTLDGSLAKPFFHSARYRVSKPMLKLQPGMHLSVDPSSRYMAIGCSEGIFAIYSLLDRKKREEALPNLRYVETERYVHFKGVILKMEFLYPTEGDKDHIILLLLVINKGRTRMLVYEWCAGDDLSTIKPHGRRGHLLEQSRQMPSLLIPLKIRSSFILVCEDSMSICQNILEGSPTFIDFNNSLDPPTLLHHGSGIPLWTAWTRPQRLPDRQSDDIYIIREDGLVKFLDTDPFDEEIVRSHNNIGELGANCGSALASLHYVPKPIRSGDLLVASGDSCPGGTYLIQARQLPFFIQTIQNWAPLQDFVTTYAAQDRDIPTVVPPIRPNSKALLKSDRIFSSVGKGLKGAICEFRNGLEANISLDMEYDTPVVQAWVLYPTPGSVEDIGGSLFLLSMADRSAVLHLDIDASNVTELSEESTSFDLRYRTLAAATFKNCIIQVTEQSIALISGTFVRIHKKEDILAIQIGDGPPRTGEMVADAAICEDVVLFTTLIDHTVYLQALSVEDGLASMDIDDGEAPAPNTHVRTVTELQVQVSSLAIGKVGPVPCAIIATWDDSSIGLIFQPIAGGDHKSLRVPSTYGHTIVDLEAIVSIAIISGHTENLILLCGTRNGIVLTLEIDQSNLEIVNSRYDRVGASTVIISRDEYAVFDDVFFMNCDSKIYALMPSMSEDFFGEPRRWFHSLKIHQIWLTDTSRPDLQQPKINSLARQRRTLAGTDGRLLLATGSQLMLAGLSMHPKAVPRYIPIGGTPTRLIYSPFLDVLIVAVIINGRSNILFFDPQTGADLSNPIDQKMKLPVDYVSGLGNENEKIYRLFEWAYTKENTTWNFLIVSTSTGRLLILSIDNIRLQKGLEEEKKTGKRSPISFYTRHKFRCSDPVYTVVGVADGLLWCSGVKLYYDVLDLAEKRFKRVAEYDLPSPATNLFFENDTIYALTTCHSLEVLGLITDGPDGAKRIVRTHGDQVARYTLHNTILDRICDRPIHLISDKMCSLVGLWPTKDAKADTLEPIFEAELPYSILKFRFGRCRPIWDPVWNQICDRVASDEASSTSLEMIPNMVSHSELLGVSITGSLSHFTFLDLLSWRFLRFIINMALRSSTICDFTYQDGPSPHEIAMEPMIMMHIDGDILKRCLDDRRLEELLGVHDARRLELHGVNVIKRTWQGRLGTLEVGLQDQLLQERFVQLLHQLHRDKLEKNKPMGFYLDQAYADLEFFLRPVI